jgi:hypothetical protein
MGLNAMLRGAPHAVPADSVLYVELKHWKSSAKKMSLLGWSFAPFETLVDITAEEPTARCGQLLLHLWRKPLDLHAHERRTQLKPLHLQEHDLFLTIGNAD